MREVFVLTQQQLTTNRQKGHHLTQIERGMIASLHSEGHSARQIASIIGVSHQTINNELSRGTIKQVKKINGEKHYLKVYCPEAAQARYEENRSNSRRPLKFKQVTDFLAYFDDKFHTEHWSPDATVGYAKKHRLFSPHKMICAKTLYNYIDAQLLEIRNIDLVEKVRRRMAHHKTTKVKRLAGSKSIDERPKKVNNRHEFGHFEIDTVVGERNGSQSVLLTFTERKTRFEIVSLIEGKDADSVSYALRNIVNQYGDIIKTVTADNGTEFTTLETALNGIADTYFAHPYTSSERGTNEVHNRMLRRYFPKGQSLDIATPSQVQIAQSHLNNLPRRILKFKTPAEAFEREVKRARKAHTA